MRDGKHLQLFSKFFLKEEIPFLVYAFLGVAVLTAQGPFFEDSTMLCAVLQHIPSTETGTD